jgi:protein FRA10AC1
MRWRVEKEVVDSKGQFICGEKKCSKSENLKTWEVNFAYLEHGEHKNCLVKLSEHFGDIWIWPMATGA